MIRRKVRFESDSLVEGDGFEPSVPRQIRSRFESNLMHRTSYIRLTRVEEGGRDVGSLFPLEGGGGYDPEFMALAEIEAARRRSRGRVVLGTLP